MVKRAADSNLSLKKIAHKKSEKEPQLHKSIFQVGGLPDGTKVFYRTPAKNFPGIKQGFGIFCLCCNEEVKPTAFEAHAGMPSRKKPYENIYLESGMSLHDYALELKPKNQNLANNDDGVCRVRETGGHVSCSGCRKLNAYLKQALPGKYCAKNAQRRLQILARRLQAVLLHAYYAAYDFIEGRLFHDRTSLICDQEVPDAKVNWYCTLVCREIHYQLKLLMNCGPEKVPDYLLDLLRKKLKEGDADDVKDRDVKFMLIRGKKVEGAFETTRLLEAINIFNEQFNPIIDKETRKDFITEMAHGNNIGDSFEFSGVCTAMITVKAKVVTAGMFRVFGEATAELSIVATSEPYKQKGYFSVLFKCIEKLLSYLCIKKIVIPASVDAESMWKEKFGFENMTTEQLEEYRKTQPSMMAFMGTSLLVKEGPTGQRTFRNLKTFRLEK
ncbi:increased DNA methylation 1 [Tanacetum coccineum]